MANRRRIAVAASALVVTLAACADVAPTATPRPPPSPGPPILRPQTWSYDGGLWTFEIIVNPNGDPTTVTLEWGSDGAYDRRLTVAQDLVVPWQGPVTSAEIPAEPSICPRFRATNAFGSVTVEVGCRPDLPQRTVAPP